MTRRSPKLIFQFFGTNVLLFLIFFTSQSLYGQTGLDLYTENFQGNGMFDSTEWNPQPNLFGMDGIVDVKQTGSNYYVRMGKSKDGGFTTNALDWHVALDGATQVALTFDIFNNRDETHDDNDPAKVHENDGIFLSSDSGNTFVKVYDFDPSNWCQRYGRLPPLDIDKIVSAYPNLSFTSQFVIRFQQYDNSDFISGGDADGFYLDNFRLYDPQTTYDTLPFFDDFQDNGFLGSAWAWGNPGITSDSIYVTINGIYGLDSNGGLTGANGDYGIVMGKGCDPGSYTQKFHANALDLHLNLLGQDQVALEFDLKDGRDETHSEDGIWFSSDGGNSFTQIYQFKFSEDWCNSRYGRLTPLDLDELIKVNPSLSFTANCVIRFQQYDDADFISGGDADGYYLDNVRVYDPAVVFIDEFPFLDNFEANGELGKWWTWSSPAPIGDLDGTADANTATGNGSFGLSSDGGIGNSYSTFMGKRCDGSFHANAFDLHLNLDGINEVEFSFYLKNINNEPHNEDGIFVSLNNGISFIQIDTFDFTSLTVGQFIQYTIDLDSALTSKGLNSLTSETIVRIQQYDDADFISGGDRDGIYLDKFQVTAESTTSIDNNELESFQVYPNPSNDILTIKNLLNENSPIDLRIMDLSGRILIKQDNMKSSLSVSIKDIPNGIYILQIEQNGKRMTKKIVKQ